VSVRGATDFEHGQHAVGDRITSGGVSRPEQDREALSRANRPPTTTMPWTKFEPDINGVCRIAGTLPMITQPAKAASMKT
jgi:hypothetical protein